VRAGARYAYRIDGRGPLPDPASRYQPDGVHGLSEVVDPRRFDWTDRMWSRVAARQPVIYELHVGVFSPEGTFSGVEARLPELEALGVTTLELMPVAEFPGRRNWGYDGVDLFAPSHHYGTPDDFRRLVNGAHARGLAVILDVVYNHLGPDGAYIWTFSPEFFSSRHQTPWGRAVNLDGPGSTQVRAFLIENALHWIHEYHIDGLRIDATHTLVDDSRGHFLTQFVRDVRARAGRRVFLTAEDERNDVRLIADPPTGYGFDAVWADDFHHQVHRALTGEFESYYGDFTGDAGDLVETLTEGWFYRGQISRRLGRPRGTLTDGMQLSRFISCLQNHDQVGNRALGERLHHLIEPAAYRAASVLLLCAAHTPLLFMGQEWSASTPFCYFTDHEPELGGKVTEGRRLEFAAFEAFTSAGGRDRIPDPQAASTFEASRLRWDERARPRPAATLRLYEALLHLRAHERALQDADPASLRAFAPIPGTLLLFRGVGGPEVVGVAVNLRAGGRIKVREAAVEAGVPSRRIDVLLSSEDPRFVAPDHPQPVTVDHHAQFVEFPRPSGIVFRLS